MVDGESCCSSSVNAIETTKTRSFSAKAHTVVVTFANSPGHTRPLLASPVEFTVTSGGAVTVPLEVSSAMGEITGTVLINGVPPGTGFVVQFAIGSGYAMVSVQLGPTGGFHALLPVGCSQCCPPLLLPPPIVLMRSNLHGIVCTARHDWGAGDKHPPNCQPFLLSGQRLAAADSPHACVLVFTYAYVLAFSLHTAPSLAR